jgi:hypothetical protein
MDLGSEQKGEVDAMLEQVCKHVTCWVRVAAIEPGS